MALFDPLIQRSVTLRNRIVVSPMCEYCAVDGVPQDWHMVHLGSRAVGGAGLVITEASAVSAEGRITHGDAGIYNDEQRDAWRRIVTFIRSQGALSGIQLAHAGRKASAQVPWAGGGPLSAAENPWPTVAPSALPFDDGWHTPAALDETGIGKVIDDFRTAAARAREAGFQVAEIHAAHGYLIHQFLSPLSNRRDDRWGGSLEGRARLLCEVVRAVREVWPDDLPVWVRISATDWKEGGLDEAQAVAIARLLMPLGVDLVDTSTGGNVAHVRIPVEPGYQVRFAETIRRDTGIATGAVGMITTAEQADHIIASGQADVVLLAREMLRDPYFPRTAAAALGVKIDPPEQYLRAW
jgi:2,4-dienoyl-CoA reductase-like NADH-dependent reductase (Old Yellow Enzyme family)